MLTAQAANTLPTNPMGIAYNSNQTNATNVAPYAQPSGLLVTGRCNRYDAVFTNARAHGAEILAYLDPVQWPDATACDLDRTFYSSTISSPLWPYPTYGQRIAFANTHLADVRAGSEWANYIVNYISQLMIDDQVDGIFLDDAGARLWTTLADWESWPSTEKDAFTNGMVDLVRRLDAARRQLNPRFIIVNNNIWDRGDSLGFAGEQYVDGVCLEHHPATSSYQQAYANRTFGNLGHRRMVVIAQSTADAQAWANVQGVTHVSDQQTYGAPSAPPTSGMTADYKRASKFVLSENATLLGLRAYLDGAGGATGNQPIKLVVYQDNAGVPGAKVAESDVHWLYDGAPANWREFTVSNVQLSAGTYWLGILSGTVGGVTRNFGDGSYSGGNFWYGNADSYADGASNSFGTGSTGATALSIYATYTVGP